jgi:hypothetical protein
LKFKRLDIIANKERFVLLSVWQATIWIISVREKQKPEVDLHALMPLLRPGTGKFSVSPPSKKKYRKKN